MKALPQDRNTRIRRDLRSGVGKLMKIVQNRMVLVPLKARKVKIIVIMQRVVRDFHKLCIVKVSSTFFLLFFS